MCCRAFDSSVGENCFLLPLKQKSWVNYPISVIIAGCHLGYGNENILVVTGILVLDYSVKDPSF